MMMTQLFTRLGEAVRGLRDLPEILRLPEVPIRLMAERAAANDPFYDRLVRDFYAEAVRPHPKLPVVGTYEYGVALCRLPSCFEAYFMGLKDSARRNCRKAERLGYEVRRFDYNSRLEDIRQIWMSTPVRQGLLPEAIREGLVRPACNPPSRDPCHDYPYFGAFRDGRLKAYAACQIYGELGNICEIYGHAEYENEGVVPMLIVGIARELFRSFPTVRYYAYETYFGASESLRRFKRKFGFLPHRVHWILETPC